MAYEIPYGLPEALRVGDTWEFKLAYADYPAGDWTLSLVLINDANKITATASQSGTDHLIQVAKATTAAYSTGSYSLTVFVDDGTSRYSIATATVEVLADVAAAGVTTHDGRSHTRTMLDAIESALEGRASTDQLDLLSSAFGARSVTRDGRSTLLEWRAKYLAYWQEELAADRRQSGKASGRFIRSAFA